MNTGVLRSTLIHLRLPFSIFLAPVFLFALSESENVMRGKAVAAFLLMHLLLFPASNAYNSYFDRDEGSIGLIRKPPPVTRALWFTALSMDLMAILLSWLLNLGLFFTLYLVLYGLVSKAYSHPSIRLKKFPVLSLLTVAVFQGCYTFLASYEVITGGAGWENNGIWIPAVLSTINLIAVYPLTQVYQHEEDRRNGDMTYSRLVGIKGTFLHAGIFFGLSFAGFGYWYSSTGRIENWFLYGAFMTPVLVYFLYWWNRVRRDESEASYEHTMRMNALASGFLNLYFLIVGWL